MFQVATTYLAPNDIIVPEIFKQIYAPAKNSAGDDVNTILLVNSLKAGIININFLHDANPLEEIAHVNLFQLLEDSEVNPLIFGKLTFVIHSCSPIGDPHIRVVLLNYKSIGFSGESPQCISHLCVPSDNLRDFFLSLKISL